MTLPPAFSLLDSEFNDFLFAPIGEESNNTVLTVLSAFARLGTDPWQEAARLAQLPREAAAQNLKSIIARLPDGSWGPSEAGPIAVRLVKLLPGRRATVAPARAAARRWLPAWAPVTRARLVLLLLCLLLGALLLFAVVNRVRVAVAGDATPPSAALASAAPAPPSPPVDNPENPR